jgi:hypothetical protein
MQLIWSWLYKTLEEEWSLLIHFHQNYWERWAIQLQRHELWSSISIDVTICSGLRFHWYLRSGNDSIRKLMESILKPRRHLLLLFFDWRLQISPYLDAAYKAANPNQFEKDFIETDKVNLMESALVDES